MNEFIIEIIAYYLSQNKVHLLCEQGLFPIKLLSRGKKSKIQPAYTSKEVEIIKENKLI